MSATLGNLGNVVRPFIRAAFGNQKFGDRAFALINNVNDRSIRSVDVTVTTGQILALFATPVELVAAPSATQYLEFISAQFFLDYNSAAYAGIAAGEDWVVKQENAAGPEVSGHIETTGFLDLTADARRHVMAAANDGAVADYTPVAAKALVLHQLVAEITTGDSPVKVRTYYRVIDVLA